LIAHEIAGERRPSFITNYVEVEAHALLLRKLGRSLARQWLLGGGLPVVRVSPREEERGKELLEQYSDKDWSLCDAISFAVIEGRRVDAAFSFDRHFLQFGRCRVLGAD
jgi:predicted nucleic acid-binding protein